MLKWLGLWVSLLFVFSNSLSWLMSIFFLFFFFSLSFLFFYSSSLSAIYVSDYFYMDSVSVILLMMTFWVMSMVMISSQEVMLTSQDSKLFMGCNITLVGLLSLLFTINHSFFFYSIFEMVLVPTILLIMGWGNQPARLNASFYFAMYTVFSSLPFLAFLMSNFWDTGNSGLPFSMSLSSGTLNWGVFFLVSAFLVKLPMYGVHLWLPKAHVEAPVGGSMILAAILLKMGIYGFYRFLYWEMLNLMWMSSVVMSISMVGGVLISFLCLNQFDMKSLVAYSSVAHMGMAVAGIYSGNGIGWSGAYLMAVAHGFASSGFFAMVTFIYEGSSSRSLIFNKGLLMKYPIFSFFLFINAMTNMAAPPSLNLMSEIFLYLSVMSYSKFIIFFFFIISVVGVGYNVVLYVSMSCGKSSNQVNQSLNMSGSQFFVLFLHSAPCFGLILVVSHFLYF